MQKREFIKAGLLGVVGFIALPSFAGKRKSFFSVENGFRLPELPFSYGALEPFFDRQSMVIHHREHHAAFVNSLNKLLPGSSPSVLNARTILRNASDFPTPVVENAGGFVNHKIFWKSISPRGGGNPEGRIGYLINRDFGSYANFKEQFNRAAKNHFGPGWVWLVNTDRQLRIVTTTNNDNPVMNNLPAEKRGFPLLCLDIWEHAYYLKYQDRRNDYVDAFWNVVNWQTADRKLKKGLTS